MYVFLVVSADNLYNNGVKGDSLKQMWIETSKKKQYIV